jgi:ankyrin repeat protein
LTFKNMRVVPLGRDIAEAEVAATTDINLPTPLHAKLLAGRKRWYELFPVLDTAPDEAWSKNLRRNANLASRRTHRRLAKAAVENDVETLQGIIDEIDDAELLNEIANTDVGITGYGNQFGTPLLAAGLRGSTAALQLFADSGVDLSQPQGVFGLDALKAACFGNQVETVKTLLALGESPNARNSSGFRALHEAAKWSGPEVTKLILDAGANVTSITSRRFNALQELADIHGSAKQFGDNEYAQFAVSERRLQVARILVEAGLDPHAKIDNRRSAMELAEKHDDIELVELFQELSDSQPKESEPSGSSQ